MLNILFYVVNLTNKSIQIFKPIFFRHIINGNYLRMKRRIYFHIMIQNLLRA